ncbi:hypothetical protein BP6252_01625 [Coleophoma cylindrospora]|uniref:AB hydrolase-1 domain-containing protein n=1 Tax=Coleophoma cylindrospora TaxID=1849047 RepID=A0A3D8STE2_9HELO|nr:hypothetical protein BP6252_01625 [Coleophoma cylindrospora]
MSRPTFILTPTTNHPPSVYNNLATALFRHGYTSIKISLPTVLGPQSPVASSDFQPDVIALRNGLMTLVIEDEREVIVVMHGYSSLPGCEAVRGLSKRDREREGKRGGVIRLVFIMAWLPQEGFQSAERGDTSSFLPWVAVDEITHPPNQQQAGTSTIHALHAPGILYNDLPPETAQYWTSQLRPQSLGVYWSPISFAAWRYIPSTYVLCGQDRVVTPEYAELIVQAARTSGGECALDRVERCESAGHCVMIGHVDWCVGMLRRAAGEAV